MRLVITIFWIILAFFVLWVFSLNVGQTVQIDLFFTKFEQVNLITVTFALLFIGFAFGILFFLIQLAKSKKEHFQLKKQINALLAELSELKSKSNDIKSIESSDDNTSDNPITEK